MPGTLEDRVVVITGGTGSLGQVLVRRLVSGDHGMPRKVIVFSRDEAKQHAMRLELRQRPHGTDEAIYRDSERRIEFRIGDVRDFHAVASVLRTANVVVNAAALKQVPTCEYVPYEAVQTNIGGAENIVRAIRELRLPVDVVVGVSTDKACQPINVMGMTKAIGERVFVAANLTVPETRFICVRYGNVLASTGSVIPLFADQIRSGGPLTITTPEMTRFLLPLERAVDTVLDAIAEARAGETWVPRVPSARIVDVAAAMIGDRPIETTVTGIRPGEKVHEILVSSEEAGRVRAHGDYFVIEPMLPELRGGETLGGGPAGGYSSADELLSLEGARELLGRHGILDEAASSSPDRPPG
jgi:FlaA1/EpsC-like NDP-sugar epimerase